MKNTNISKALRIYHKPVIKDYIKNLSIKFKSLDFSKFDVATRKTLGELICKNCDRIFKTSINTLIERKNSPCTRCGTKIPLIYEYFVDRAKYKHKEFYLYHKVVAGTFHKFHKVTISCPEHGDFQQLPSNHLGGQGCPKCKPQKLKKALMANPDEFIEQCKAIHKNYYSYEEAVYGGALKNIKIKCPKHGFFHQKAKNHKNGLGCSKCSSSFGEKKIEEFLEKNGVEYYPQKIFKDCLHKKKGRLRFDFFIPSLNLCIEFQGVQHFKAIKYWGGEVGFQEQKIRDQIKRDYCKTNNIKLLEIAYSNFKKIDVILNTNI